MKNHSTYFFNLVVIPNVIQCGYRGFDERGYFAAGLRLNRYFLVIVVDAGHGGVRAQVYLLVVLVA